MSGFSFALIMEVVAVHWLADFCLQTHEQAQNKSKNTGALFRHCATYTIALLLVFGFTGWMSAAWCLLNGALHFAVDFCTCRITSKLYAEQRYHDFFATIGADQVLHYAALFGTAGIMF